MVESRWETRVHEILVQMDTHKEEEDTVFDWGSGVVIIKQQQRDHTKEKNNHTSSLETIRQWQ